MPELPFYLIDAFCTEDAFSGNPAGVVVLKEPAHPAWMQAVAAEINQAETAFVWPEKTTGKINSWQLRWFTPLAEVDLCGHATLATAAALQAHNHAAEQYTFATNSGLLHVEPLGDSRFTMNFPSTPASGCTAPNF